MDGCFDRIETGSSEKNRKSEAMKAISLYYGFKSNEMIYVGDAVSDIEACNSVKIQCLSAAWAASTDCEQLENIIPVMSLVQFGYYGIFYFVEVLV